MLARAVFFLALLFLALALWRALRLVLSRLLAGRAPVRRPPAVEREMVRDPVCGAWIDRRAAVAGLRGQEPVEVCSEKCRRALEAG